MVNRSQVAAWWEKEKLREHTKLECGLIGAILSAVAIAFVFVVRVSLI